MSDDVKQAEARLRALVDEIPEYLGVYRITRSVGGDIVAVLSELARLRVEVEQLRGALAALLAASAGTFCAAVGRAKKLVGEAPPGIAVQVGAYLRGSEEHDDIGGEEP